MAYSNSNGYRAALLSTLLSYPFGRAFMLPSDIASQYQLSTSTSLPFPSATQSNTNTQNTLVNGWSLNKGRIQQGSDNIAFVPDPFPHFQLPSSTVSSSSSSSSGPVLQVTYAEGGFGSQGSGTQFYSLWNTPGDPFKTVLLTYEVAFDSTFDWVKGGKLPGLRGGPDTNTCDGGSASDGTCFSTRVMWRKSGDGEGTYTAPWVFGVVPELYLLHPSLRIYPVPEQSLR